MYSAVAVYARDAFLKTLHNSRHVLKHMILAEFFGTHIISEFDHKVRLYYYFISNLHKM